MINYPNKTFLINWSMETVATVSYVFSPKVIFNLQAIYLFLFIYLFFVVGTQ